MRVSLSLRDKVLILMTSLTAVTLALYLYVAVQIFRQDKMAEVSYNSAAVARNLATQAHIELEAAINALKPIVQTYDFRARVLAPTAADYLKAQKKISHVTLFQPLDSQRYTKVVELPESPGRTLSQDSPELKLEKGLNLAEIAADGTYVSVSAASGQKQILLGVRFGPIQSPNHLVAIATIDNANFVEAIEAPSQYANAMISKSAEAIFAGSKLKLSELPPLNQWQFLHDLLVNQPPPGTVELKLPGKVELLMAYAHVGIGKAVVISYTTKNEAMAAVRLLVTKSALVFIALLCATIITALLTSKGITRALSRLTRASTEIASGRFDIQLEVNTTDEIGSLAKSFNTMAAQLKYHIAQVAEKASLEAELNTARAVQETLFPPEYSLLEKLEIAGRYEPAGQCGGDWWFYSRVGEKIFMWIGDATGHGVPAALLTSAARSAASIIEMFPEVTPGQALGMLNRAIHETSKGKLLMTFFVASLDLRTNRLSYANASHEPPWLLRHKPEGEKFSRKDIVPLQDANNPRLGEGPRTEYREAHLEMAPGDRIFFYTDGLSELRNPEGEYWGERRFTKSIMSALNQSQTPPDVVGAIQGEATEFRDGARLEDDVTFFVCRMRDAA